MVTVCATTSSMSMLLDRNLVVPCLAGVAALAFLFMVLVRPWLDDRRDRVELRREHVGVYDDGKLTVLLAVADIQRCVLYVKEVWHGVGASVGLVDEGLLVLYLRDGRVEQLSDYRRGFWKVVKGLRKSGVRVTEERVPMLSPFPKASRLPKEE